MVHEAVRYAGAVLAGLLSLSGVAYSAKLQVAEARLFVGDVGAQIAPLPDGLLPTGIPRPSYQPPLGVEQRRALRGALYHDPLDARLFNLIYVDGVRTGETAGQIRHNAELLGQLGWRYTPAQLNLLFRNLLDNRFDVVLDHIDALLRRRKLSSVATSMLMTMETIPEGHREVVDRLQGNPGWRRDYLSVIGPQTSSVTLEARTATIAALLRTPQGMTRDEIAPSLNALVATGRARAAHSLWIRHVRGLPDGNLVYDPRFQEVAAAEMSDRRIPFEWSLGAGLNYAARLSQEGVTISWDRSGVPTFLSQLVPLSPGRGYALTVRGRSDTQDLSKLLAPVITCAATNTRFIVAASTSGYVRYTASALPESCNMGVLTISGALDTGAGGVDFGIREITLRTTG